MSAMTWGSRAAVRIIVGGALLLSGCTSDTSSDARHEQRENDPRTAPLDVVEDRSSITSPFVVGEEIHGLPGNDTISVDATVHAPFSLLAPAILADDDHELVGYHSVEKSRPTLTILDLNTGRERVLDRGAFSLAWADDGRLAYFEGVEERVRNPNRYRGHVVFRRSPDAPARQWSDQADRYTVTAWAGKNLLVHRLGTTWPDLLVFEGPGDARVLARSAALIAVSPDGEQVFLTNEPSPAPRVTVVDVSNGDVVAELDLRAAARQIGARVDYVGDSGSWTGARVFAAAAGGLATFRVSEGEIALEQVLTLDPDSFPTGLIQPRVDDAGRSVTAVAEWVRRPRAAVSANAVLQCDPAAAKCVLGESIMAPYSPHVMYNPSRP